MTRRQSREQGSVTLEIVIAVPVLLTAVLITLNAALWYHARNIALSAAQEGVRTARAHNANPTTSGSNALEFARDTGDGFLLSPAVDTSGTTGTTIVVRVSGKAVTLVPGLNLTVSQVARGTRERFTTPTLSLMNLSADPHEGQAETGPGEKR